MSDELWETCIFAVCVISFCVGWIAGGYHGYAQRQLEEDKTKKDE